LEWASLSISWIKIHANKINVTLAMDFLTNKCYGVYCILFRTTVVGCGLNLDYKT
jgi:hypothetical protein